MEELSYELTKDFVSCVHVRFYFFTAAHFYLAARQHFSFSHCRYEIFMFFFQRNSSPLFSITRPSSSSVIHVSVNIKKKNVEKDTSFLLVGGDAISFQIKPSVAFGLGISTSCSATFSQLLVFRATVFVSSNFLRSEQFLQLSSNSEVSKQVLVLKLVFLPHFTMFQKTIYEFPVKKEPNSSPWARSWAQDKSGWAARSAVLRGVVGLCRAIQGYAEQCQKQIYYILTNVKPLNHAYTTYLPKIQNGGRRFTLD